MAGFLYWVIVDPAPCDHHAVGFDLPKPTRFTVY